MVIFVIFIFRVITVVIKKESCHDQSKFSEKPRHFSALYMQRCEKSTNHMEGVHINKGPLSEISIFIYCRRQRWSSSSEENICEEPVSNLFKGSKVSVEIVY